MHYLTEVKTALDALQADRSNAEVAFNLGRALKRAEAETGCEILECQIVGNASKLCLHVEALNVVNMVTYLEILRSAGGEISEIDESKDGDTTIFIAEVSFS